MNACDYCHAGGTMVIMLDLEEMLDHLDPIVRSVPSQRLYKFGPRFAKIMEESVEDDNYGYGCPRNTY